MTKKVTASFGPEDRQPTKIGERIVDSGNTATVYRPALDLSQPAENFRTISNDMQMLAKFFRLRKDAERSQDFDLMSVLDVGIDRLKLRIDEMSVSAGAVVQQLEAVQTRNVRINGKRTSVALEYAFWDALTAISSHLRCRIDDLCEIATSSSPSSTVASALRVFALVNLNMVREPVEEPQIDDLFDLVR